MKSFICIEEIVESTLVDHVVNTCKRLLHGFDVSIISANRCESSHLYFA